MSQLYSLNRLAKGLLGLAASFALTSAAEAARTHVFETLGWDTAVSYIDPQNARSIALAERLGAVRDDSAARPHPDDLVYRHPKPEAV